jgi:hypothetical protein
MRRREAPEESERRAEKPMQEYVTCNAAVTVRTARLQLLRLAEEAAAGNCKIVTSPSRAGRTEGPDRPPPALRHDVPVLQL